MTDSRSVIEIYLARIQVEKNNLDKLIERFLALIAAPEFEAITQKQQDAFRQQYDSMVAYSRILEGRMAIHQTRNAGGSDAANN